MIRGHSVWFFLQIGFSRFLNCIMYCSRAVVSDTAVYLFTQMPSFVTGDVINDGNKILDRYISEKMLLINDQVETYLCELGVQLLVAIILASLVRVSRCFAEEPVQVSIWHFKLNSLSFISSASGISFAARQRQLRVLNALIFRLH